MDNLQEWGMSDTENGVGSCNAGEETPTKTPNDLTRMDTEDFEGKRN
jgi:hypothetical protein